MTAPAACVAPAASHPAPVPRERCEELMRLATDSVRAYVLRSRLPASQFDDAIQECYLQLWPLTERYDPARGTKWSTYVISVVNRVINRMMCDEGKGFAKIGGVGFPSQLEEDAAESFMTVTVGDGDEEPDPDVGFDELNAAVRLKLSEPPLARLGDTARAIVEMVAFEGITPDQAAARLGLPVKDLKLYLRNAHRTLTRPDAPARPPSKAKTPPGVAGRPGGTHPGGTRRGPPPRGDGAVDVGAPRCRVVPKEPD